MGTRRRSWFLIPDSISNWQLGGRLSRESSPRPGTGARPGREQERMQAEEGGREAVPPRIKEKAGTKADRYTARDQPYVPKATEGERERRERERRAGEERCRNGKMVSNLELEIRREVDVTIGGTFPQTRKVSREREVEEAPPFGKKDDGRRMKDRPLSYDWERERDGARGQERRREGEKGYGDRRRERMDRGRGGPSGVRPLEDGTVPPRGRRRDLEPGHPEKQRERSAEVAGQRDKRYGERAKPRAGGRERKATPSSPKPRGGDTEVYADGEDGGGAVRRAGQRITRSEGDSDGGVARGGCGAENHHHSRSEGEVSDVTYRERDRHKNKDRHGEPAVGGVRGRGAGGEMGRVRERDRERERDRVSEAGKARGRDKDVYRERDRQMYREKDRVSETGKDVNREKDRVSETGKATGRDKDIYRERDRDVYRERDMQMYRERDKDVNRERDRVSETGKATGRDKDIYRERDRDVYRERDMQMYREKDRGRERDKDVNRERDSGQRHKRPEAERRWTDPSQENAAGSGSRLPRGPAIEARLPDQSGGKIDVGERGRDGCDDRKSGRKSPAESERGGGRGWNDGGTGEKSDGGIVPEQRRTGAEPGSRSPPDNDFVESWRTSGPEEGHGDRTRPRETCYDEGMYREGEGVDEGESSAASSRGGDEGDGEPPGDGVAENAEETCSERLSGEDGFVTLSSSGDGEGEFEDCRDYWEAGGPSARQPSGFKEHERDWQDKRREEREGGEEEDRPAKGRRPKYVFCVIGQTLPRSSHAIETSETHRLPGVETSRPNSGSDGGGCYGDTQRAEDYGDHTVETEPSEDEPFRVTNISELDDRAHTDKDSETERLLSEWRERLLHKREQFSSSSANSHGDSAFHENCVAAQRSLDGVTHRTRSLDLEKQASIQLHMNRAWSLAEDVTHYSKAPHLKWASSVVRDILGSSEERVCDDPCWDSQGGPKVSQYDGRGIRKEEQAGEMRETAPLEEDPLEAGALRGMGQSLVDMHADHLRAHTMHGDTLAHHTHTDTPLDTAGREPGFSGGPRVERPALTGEGGDVRVAAAALDDEAATEEEVQMYLSVSNALYKPHSCPSLSYVPVAAGDAGSGEEDGTAESEDEPEERGVGAKVDEMSCGEGSEENSGEVGGEVEGRAVAGVTVKNGSSFRDLSPKVRTRRMGLRKAAERRRGELVEGEEEGVGRDRRTRIFTSDDEETVSKSMGEIELRSALDSFSQRRRKSKYFKAVHPLYQQYNEAAQNNEILCQSHSDTVSASMERADRLDVPGKFSFPSRSRSPSPRPSCRPLPAPPLAPHSHFQSLPHSWSRAKHLPLPETPRAVERPPSPRLSISLGQSSTLWQHLPGVKDSAELDGVTEDQRRLQEVRFEVVTSEASYCSSLEIVVEYFVMSKQLGALLTTQDRNWLFSRLADVRAISHSFLSKLEERVDSDIMHFTVCDLIARHCPRFKRVYVPYLTNQSYQDATYQRLMNENPGFKRIVEKLERNPVCQRLPLRSFLILPFQRITRMKLLVQNIVKRTAPGTEDEIQAIKALKLLEMIIQESNDSISRMKNIESLVSLSSMVDFECRTLPLISQSRRLVREGPVTQLMEFSLKEVERSVYLHLFNDYLLVSLHKEGGRFVVIDHAPVSDLRAENCRFKLHSLQKNLLRLYIAQNALLLRTDTQSDKLRWISAVSRPHPEVDFSAAQDLKQMQCMRAFVAQQPDELSLEKADVILVHQQSSDGWVEGSRLSDLQCGWMPVSHLEVINNPRVLQHNLSDALKLTTARESTNSRHEEVLVSQ